MRRRRVCQCCHRRRRGDGRRARRRRRRTRHPGAALRDLPRLQIDDLNALLAPAAEHDHGSVLFRREYEIDRQAAEVNRFAGGIESHTALVETANGYRFYFGVYVRSVSRFTPIYMALIDPFRKLVVYPSLLRTVRAKWNKTFGTA
jgi:hypothetical protein